MEFATGEALKQASDPVVIMQGSCSDTFKNQVLAIPGVLSSACSQSLPQLGIGIMSSITPAEEEQTFIRNLSIDSGFFETYDLQLVAGRFFSEQFATDFSPLDNVWLTPEALVINEEAIKEFGYDSAEDAIGRTLSFDHMYKPPVTFTGPHTAIVIGVVESFQIGSIREQISPAVFYVDKSRSSAMMSVKINGETIPETLAALDRLWLDNGNDSQLPRYFFEGSVQALYADIQRQAQLFSIFSGIAILIAILGLVGLAAHTAVTRTKEIGIRKSLGGTRYSIITLLLWQFSKPVLWANIIAWPLAYLAMSRWLESFASRVELGLWMFLASTVVTFVIAILAVALHAYTMSGAKPVLALRYE